MEISRMMEDELPYNAKCSVLRTSENLPEGTPEVKGYDFNRGINYEALLQTYMTTGFQAMHFSQAVQEVNNMINAKLYSPGGCSIYLGYTSNMISSGVREIIRYLVEHKMVDALITTAGGIEEDFMKCYTPIYLGDFALKGAELRTRGINRLGNLLVPNNNYCKFETWINPILDQMVLEQEIEGTKWTPSKMIARLGKEINNKESVYYWAYKNNIPVYSPALTDGSLGDMFFFHSYKKPGLRLDIIEDVCKLDMSCLLAKKTGMLILGGGLIKHHVLNANSMRNGADYSVFINTASEFDGSDAGARPDEAKSWGKIHVDAKPVKVYADSTLIFPLLVAQTFAKRQADFTKKKGQAK
ncbi:deoxyhypusine synthase-like [Gastrophryne carolinensis]